jgi:hypothetical protein
VVVGSGRHITIVGVVRNGRGGFVTRLMYSC